MKTFPDCCREVAEKYGLGTNLVTGHLAKYWKEAAEMYAKEREKETAIEFYKYYNGDLYGNLSEAFDQFRKEKGVCQRSGCELPATCEGYCGAHCNCKS